MNRQVRAIGIRGTLEEEAGVYNNWFAQDKPVGCGTSLNNSITLGFYRREGRPEIGSRRSDVRCQRSEVGCRRSDVRGRRVKTDAGGPMTEV